MRSNRNWLASSLVDSSLRRGCARHPGRIPGIRSPSLRSNRSRAFTTRNRWAAIFIFARPPRSRRCNCRLTSAYHVYRASHRRWWFRSASFVTREPDDWSLFVASKATNFKWKSRNCASCGIALHPSSFFIGLDFAVGLTGDWYRENKTAMETMGEQVHVKIAGTARCQTAEQSFEANKLRKEIGNRATNYNT